MDAMATWQDGPEYAPTARPDAFVSPDAAPLTPSAPAGTTAGVGVPPGAPRPDYAPAPEGDVPLDRIGAPTPTQRDPHQAFAVETTPLTSPGTLAVAPSPTLPLPGWAPPTGQPASAWGAVHAPQAPPRPQQAWAPELPFQPPVAPPMNVPAPASAWPPPQVNPSTFPPPQPPGWYPAQPDPPGPGPLRPVTLAQMLAAATPAVVIALVAGGIVTPVSLPLFLVANVLAARVRHRRARVRQAFQVGLVASVVLGAIGAWFSPATVDVVALWGQVNGWSQLACWAVAAAVLLIQGDALRRGEPPESLV